MAKPTLNKFHNSIWKKKKFHNSIWKKKAKHFDLMVVCRKGNMKIHYIPYPQISKKLSQFNLEKKQQSILIRWLFVGKAT